MDSLNVAGRKIRAFGEYAECCDDAPDLHGPCNSKLFGLCEIWNDLRYYFIYNLNSINQWLSWVIKWRSDLETTISIPGMFQTSNKGHFPIPNDSVQTESNLFGSVAMLLFSNNFNDNQLSNNCLISFSGKEKTSTLFQLIKVL